MQVESHLNSVKTRLKIQEANQAKVKGMNMASCIDF